MVKKVAASASELSVQSALAEVVQTDPQLKKRIRRILNALIADIEHQLTYGSPSERAMLARSVVPAMMRSLATNESSDKETKDALAEMFAMLRGEDPSEDSGDD
jgi:hypothetical protein